MALAAPQLEQPAAHRQDLVLVEQVHADRPRLSLAMLFDRHVGHRGDALAGLLLQNQALHRELDGIRGVRREIAAGFQFHQVEFAALAIRAVEPGHQTKALGLEPPFSERQLTVGALPR